MNNAFPIRNRKQKSPRPNWVDPFAVEVSSKAEDAAHKGATSGFHRQQKTPGILRFNLGLPGFNLEIIYLVILIFILIYLDLISDLVQILNIKIHLHAHHDVSPQHLPNFFTFRNWLPKLSPAEPSPWQVSMGLVLKSLTSNHRELVEAMGRVKDWGDSYMGVSENVVYPFLPNDFADHYPY